MILKRIKINNDYDLLVSREEQTHRFKSYRNDYEDIKVSYDLDNFMTPIENKIAKSDKYFTLFSKGLIIDFKNELTVIVGDNGCGKTSFINLIKFNPRITVTKENNDQVVKDYLENNVRTLTFIKQPEKLIIENNIHKSAFIEYDKAVMKNSLENFQHHFNILHSSNGENTYDFINSLQTINNSLIILDEPETSLSIKTIMKLKEVFKSILKNGNQIILITHNQYIMELVHEVYDFESKKYINTQDYINLQLNGG